MSRVTGTLPQGWSWSALRELVVEGPTNGYSPRTERGATGTPTLRLSATTSGRLVLSAETTKRLGEVIPENSPLWLKPGDLLVQRSNTKELVGTAAVFDGPTHSYVYPDLMMRLRFRDEITGYFVWRYLNSRAGRSAIQRVAAGSAGSMPKINGEKLRALSVPLPPLPEQRRLVAILDKADAVRRRRQEAIRLADKFLRSAFLEMCGDPVTNPKRWPSGTIDLVVSDPKADVRCGPFGTQLKVAELVSTGCPLWGIENVRSGRFSAGCSKFLTDSKAAELSRFDARPGDVLVTRMGTIGQACVVPPDAGEARISYHLFRIRPDPKRCVSAFLAATITHSGTFLAKLERVAHGAIMSGLSTSDLRAVRFLLPPVERQLQYVGVVKKTESTRERITVSHATADALFDSLLQRAFRGQL